jgi:hypothetical protein
MYLSAMQALPKFFHYLSMCKPFFSGRGLGLCDRKFLKQFDPRLESFVMFHAHDDEVTFAIRSKVNRLVLLMAQGLVGSDQGK